MCASLLLCATLGRAQEHKDMGYGAAMLKETWTLLENKDTTAALERLARVNQNDTLYELALLSSIRILNASNDHEAAERLLHTGINFKGEKRSNFMTTHAATLYDMERYDECIAAADSVISEFPGLFRPHHLKAISLNKKGEKKLAFEQAMANAKRFPYQRDTHILLASIAAGEGKVTQSALACMMAQIVRFDDETANNVLGYYDGVLGGSLELEPDGYDLTVAGDHLDELDQLIKSKVAMNSKYKVKPDLDYPMCRQSHLLFSEVAKLDMEEQGFYVNFYGPLAKAIMDNGLFEGYIYHCLSSSTLPKVKAVGTKNKSKVDAFRARISNLTEERFCVFPEPGSTEELFHVFNGNSEFVGAGPTDATRTRSLGEWTFYHPNGKTMSTGRFNEDGEKNGAWTYWYTNGNLSNRISYANGPKNGPSMSYDRYGNLVDSLDYTNNVRQGTGCLFYPGGGRSTCKTAKDDEWTGPASDVYPTGTTMWTYALTNDEADGPMKEFYPDGTLKFEGQYTKGKRTGTFTNYYINGNKADQYTFVDGLAQGPFTKWDQNGTVIEEGTWSKGMYTGENKEYDAWGTLRTLARFNDQGRLHGIKQEYDRDGRVNFETEYKNGLLVRYADLDPTGKILGQGTRSKGKFDFQGFHANGQKRVSGTYLDEGAKDGKWLYYSADGTLESEENFDKGELKGEQKYYDEGGVLTSTTKEYDRNGATYRSFVSYYPSGAVKELSQKKGDNFEGVVTEHAPNGKVISVEYLNEGKRDGWQSYYDIDGVLDRAELIQNGIVVERVNYDQNGQEYERIRTLPGNFELVQHHPDGSVRSKLKMVNSKLHGPALWTLPNGTKDVEGTFLNDERDGKWTFYHENGKKRLEQQYRYGKLVGASTEFFDDGTVESVYTYVDGRVHGPAKEFHYNGKPAMTIEYAYGVRHGVYTTYAYDGTPQMVRFYVKGDLVGYGSPDATGAVKDTIPLAAGAIALRTQFADGTVSREIAYRNEEVDGDFKEYHPNGKVMEEATYKVGNIQGNMTSYYASGKVHVVSPYGEGGLHGVWKEFRENGNLKETETFVHGRSHGEHTFYDANGKVLVTYLVRDNDVVGIRK